MGLRGVIDSKWRGGGDLYEHEREEGHARKRTRGAAVHCLDVPEALAECKSTPIIWSSLHRLAVSQVGAWFSPGLHAYHSLPSIRPAFLCTPPQSNIIIIIALLPPKIAPDWCIWHLVA